MRQKKTKIGVDLLKILARRGYRIFDMSLAKQFAPEADIKLSYLSEAISHLKQNGWIYPLRNGLYVLDISFLGGIPIHEHEIAMFLVNPAAISHFSAFQHHGLTDQIPHVVYVSTLSCSRLPRLSIKSAMGYNINRVAYRFVKNKPAYFFGFTYHWEGSTKVTYTDYEKTLLDGLSHPHFCGGMQEVLHAFQQNVATIDVQKIISYALKLEIAATKRLGWILDHLNVGTDLLNPLLERPVKSYNKLDVAHDAKGHLNRKWMVIENI